MSAKYLIAFHIGPVQDFIVTARRTQDLWIGSWLLSHLSKRALSVAKLADCAIVLPAPLSDSPDSAIADTPNHFLARLTSDSPKNIAGMIEGAVQSEWSRIGKCVKDKFFQNVDDVLWTRQMTAFLEVYWAIVEDDGPSARDRAQMMLDARKRLRDFSYTSEPHLKCTLCGLRQEVSGKVYLSEARPWWTTVVREARGDGPLRVRDRGAERLCSICAVKRTVLAAEALENVGWHDGHFPSTSSIAAATFKRDVLMAGNGNGKAASKMQEFFDVLGGELRLVPEVDRRCLPGLFDTAPANDDPLPENVRDNLLRYDGDVFYLETFTPNRIQDFPNANTDPDSISIVALELRDVYTALKAETLQSPFVKPSKYYAALMMDGDHMGAFFGKASEAQARAMSQSVSEFSRTVAKEIVEKHLGRLVYAGGDDVMALLPLDESLRCADALAVGFNEAVARAIEETGMPDGVEHAPTPSAGIAFAHHLAPLDGVLVAMRRAESEAKNHYGRSAICVHVLKRSGEEVHLGSHWRYGDLAVMQLVDLIVKAFRAEKGLSMKFAQALAANLAGLAGSDVPDQARASMDQARASMIRRFVRRHTASGANLNQDALANSLAVWVEALSRDSLKRTRIARVGLSPDQYRNRRADASLTRTGIEEVGLWVLLARFLASGGRDES